MKTSFDKDNVVRLMLIVAFIVSILTTMLYFWPAAGAIADMVRDKELNPLAGFIGFSLFGGIVPVGSFFVTLFVLAIGATKLEEHIFARNIKFKQAAEFIIEARGNK